VRPQQSIKEEVSAFYAKVGTPLLADLQLDFGGILVEEMYPYPLPDLFAGSQLVLVGRYRRGGQTTITMRGTVNERTLSFTYPNVRFRETGGESFLPRLWATRKIGHLLAQIRLHGENKELIDEIVALSVRYGIMTPYTSFLVDEKEDVLTKEGRDKTAQKLYSEAVRATPAPSGARAVEKSVEQKALQESRIAAAPSSGEIKHVGNVTFILRSGVWVDTRYDPARMQTHKIRFGSEAYFALIQSHPAWGEYLSVGQQVIVLLDGKVYEIAAEAGEEVALSTPTDTPAPEPTPTPTLSPSATPTPGVTPAPTRGPTPWQRFWQWVKSLFE